MLLARRHRFVVAAIGLLVLVGLLRPTLSAALSPNPVTAAWERARASGAYRFTSDVTQVTTPSSTIDNVGSRSHEQRLRLEGETDLARRRMELRLWGQGGSALQPETGIAVKVEGGKTWMRAGTGAWQEGDELTGSVAPGGDFMAYLSAVRDVSGGEPATRDGLAFTRYTFALDGATFGAYLRDQLEIAMRAQGALAPGAHIDVPRYYAEMRGDGELWVSRDGLPIRQILHIQFPEQKGEHVSATMTTNFSNYASLPVAWLGVARLQIILVGLRADPSPLFSIAIWLTLSMLLVRYHRSRWLQKAVPVLMIVAILVTPLMSGSRTKTFLTAQSAKAAERDEARQESNMERSLRKLQSEQQFDPHRSPLTASAPADSVIATAAPSTVQLAAPTSDNGADTDRDGLTNYLEQRIGTSPKTADTDDDGVSDKIEVEGFSYSGRMWYTDPQELDSNKDGQSDVAERFVDANNDNTYEDANNDGVPDPRDTDGDGIPDVWDTDNDNDGVPDRKDLSPTMHSHMSTGAQAPFSQSQSFDLRIDGVEDNLPVMVDFQVRPTNPQHLWYALNKLDWPADREGQFQDGNNTPDDLELLPMLEIRVPTGSANLPSQAELTPYGVTMNPLEGGGTVVYVPLTVQVDEQTGERVALTAHMLYRPGSSWGAIEHQVRMVWAARGTLDRCQQMNDGQCSDYGGHFDESQMLHAYYDEWRLAGINVREDRGTKLAAIYENPAVDTDLSDDAALWELAAGLDNAFLSAKDCDVEHTDTKCVGDGTRDVRIEDIATRFNHTTNEGISDQQRWGIANTLQVRLDSYPTLDHATMTTAMTTTKSLLRDNFNTRWSTNNQIKPLIMYAREEQYRAAGLDAAGTPNVTLAGTRLIVNLYPSAADRSPLLTLAGLNWTAYCADRAVGNAPNWDACPQATYWDEIEARHLAAAGQSGDTQGVIRGRLMIAQIYALSLLQGATNVVQHNTRPIAPFYSLKTDAAMEATIRSLVGIARSAVPGIANLWLMTAFVRQDVADDTYNVLKYLGDTILRDPVTGDDALLGLIVKWVKSLDKVRLGVLVGVAVVVVAALVVGITFLVKGLMQGGGAGNLAAKIIVQVIVVSLVTVLSVVGPLAMAINLYKSLGAAVLQKSSALVGMSPSALAIGAVIGVAITWGFFIYSVVANKVGAFSPEFNKLFAEAIATTIMIVLLAALSASVIGLIIVGIVAVIDLILTAICELGVDALRKVPGLGGACFTLNTAAIKAIAKLIYSYDLMVDMERKDLVVLGELDVARANKDEGFVSGNALTISVPVTTTIVHKDPATENLNHVLPYLWFWSQDNLRSSTIQYALSRPAKTDIKVDRGQMSNQWQNVAVDHKWAKIKSMYRGQSTKTLALDSVNLPAGLNRTLDFYFNMGYAVPAYECWSFPSLIPPLNIPVCYKREFDGKSSTHFDALVFDILPDTVDGFMRMTNKGDGGIGMAWDDRFTSLADADADGLNSVAHGGLDPNDANWDADSDGLSDKYELERRATGVGISPNLWDTDSDGLTDAQEAHFGTNPASPDSDLDGLTDAQEIDHEVYTFNGARNRAELASPYRREGGWVVTVPGVKTLDGNGSIVGERSVSIRVSSDPGRADSDGDGLTDAVEKQLAEGPQAQRLDAGGMPYHPAVYNANPLTVNVSVRPEDRIVRPGETVNYSTAVDTGGNAFAPGVLDVTVPSVFGADLPPARINLDQGSQTATRSLTVQSAMSGPWTLESTVNARLKGSTGPEWQWQPPTNEAPLGTVPSGQRIPGRFVEQTAVRPDRGDRYLVSELTSDSSAQNGRGDVNLYAPETGQFTIAESDPNDPYTGRPNTPNYLRGVTPARSACNDVGQCLTVWDSYDNCNTLTITNLRVVDAKNDHGTPGIEPVIFLNGADRYYAGQDLKANDTRAPNLTQSFCGHIDVEVREWDGNSNFELIGSFTSIQETGNTIGTLVFSGNCSGNNCNRVDVTYTIQERHVYDVMGSAGTAAGARSRSQFSLTNGGNMSNFDFNPVVATDGNGFLAAWERVSIVSAINGSYTYRSEVVWRRFNGDGTPASNEQAYPISQHTEGCCERSFADLDIVWAGNTFRILHKLRKNGTVSMFDVNAGGAWMGTLVTVTTTASGPARLAYDPNTNRTLVVWVRSQVFDLYGRLYNGNSAGNEQALFADAYANYPKVAYHAQTGGWLVSWTLATSTYYELLKQDLTPLVSNGRQTRAWNTAPNGQGGALACPAPNSVPNVDLRFEELPGATSYADMSGRGYEASVVAGAPKAGTIVSGSRSAPASDYALTFDGDDALSINRPVGGDFTISFWLRTTQGYGTDQSWYDGAGLIDGWTSGTFSDFGVSLGSGKILFGTGNPNTTIRSGVIADGGWHHVVATRQRATGQIKLYVDGTEVASSNTGNTGELTNAAHLRIGSLLNGSKFYQGELDNITIYGSALGSDTIGDLRNGSLANYCVIGAAQNTGLPWSRLYLDRPDRRGAGPLTARSSLKVLVDGNAPSSTIQPADGTYVQGTLGGTQTVIVGGTANDTTSDVASVEVSVNGGNFAPADGAASWAYSLKVGEGEYTIRSQAIDVAGNRESNGPTSRIIVDATAPQLTTSGLGTTVVPGRTATGRWTVNLTGTVADPVIGTTAGSGVQPSSVEVLLQATTESTDGNGWQAATQTGDTWSLNYLLPAGLADPTGTYRVIVRAADRVGNPTAEAPLGQLRLDASGPGAVLDATDAQRPMITTALQLSGTVSDTTSIAAVEAAFMPLNQVAAQAEAVLHLPFDERAGAVWFGDTTAQGNAASCLDAATCPTTGEAGRVDRALRFNGGQLISVADAPSLNFDASAGFTLAGWIKTAGTGRIILAKRDGSPASYTLALNDQGVPAFRYGATTVTAGSTSIADDQWHHLAVVIDRDAAQSRLYVDGVERGTQATTEVVTNAASLDIGGWRGDGGGRFVGLIDEVGAYARALGTSDIAALMSAANTNWYPATLSGSGAGTTTATWSLPLPDDLEGIYQIDLRSSDSAGNRRVTANTWRGPIDVAAPRVTFTATPTGAMSFDSRGRRVYEIRFVCSAEDQNLQEASFTCPGTTRPPSRAFDNDPALQTLFPDLALRNRLTVIFHRWEPTQQVNRTARACDSYARCGTVSTSTPTTRVALRTALAFDPDAPSAAVIDPMRDVFAAGSGSLQVTIGGEATKGLRTIDVSLDGDPVRTLTFAASPVVTYTSQTITLNGVAQGKHALAVMATDQTGAKQATPFTVDFFVDAVLPAVALDQTVLDASNTLELGSGIMHFTGTASDALGLTAVQVKINDQPYTDALFGNGVWASSLSLGRNSEGKSFRISVRAIDFAGQTSETSRILKVDIRSAQPPTTDITTRPTEFELSKDASFAFTGDAFGGATVTAFQCRLDAADFEYCTSPVSFSGLADGLHNFQVRAVDSQGYVDDTPAVVAWTVDMVAPDTTLTDKPALVTNVAAAGFKFTADDQNGSGVAGVECSLDDAPFTACAATDMQTYDNLGDGVHTFQVRAYDRVNNRDASPAQYSWTVDTVAPRTSITTKPSALTSSGAARFEFVGDDGTGTGVAQVECQLDTGAWTTCTSPKEYTNLPSGSHSFRVRAVDRAGNTDLTTAEWTWTVDTVAPNTTLSGKPPVNSSTTTARFEFAGDDGMGTGIARLECQLDTGAWTTCTSPKNYSGLGDGSHTFRARAIDMVDNVDSTPAVWTWLVDSVPPDTTLTKTPPAISKSDIATFDFVGSDGGSGVAGFECKLDNGSFVACTRPHTYSGLKDGPHTVAVRALDKATNADPTPATSSWVIDTVAPDTVITAKPASVTGNSTAQFAFNGTDVGIGLARLECQLDGGGFATCTSPRTLLNLASGNHTFQVRAVDKAGNVDPSPASYTWLVDTTPPVVSCSVNPNAIWTPNHKLVAVKATVQVTDIHSGPSGFTLVSVTSNEADAKLDKEDVAGDIQLWSVNTADVDGQLRAERWNKGKGRVYTFIYRGKDVVGNTATCTTTATVPFSQGR